MEDLWEKTKDLEKRYCDSIMKKATDLAGRGRIAESWMLVLSVLG